MGEDAFLYGSSEDPLVLLKILFFSTWLFTRSNALIVMLTMRIITSFLN